LALSRQREYLADSSGALLCRNPDALADALEKISADTEPLEVANKATAHLYIANPLKGHESFLNSLFATHPPAEERIRILRAMG
jgi:heat shock protein HtpX